MDITNLVDYVSHALLVLTVLVELFISALSIQRLNLVPLVALVMQATTDQIYCVWSVLPIIYALVMTSNMTVLRMV